MPIFAIDDSISGELTIKLDNSGGKDITLVYADFSMGTQQGQDLFVEVIQTLIDTRQRLNTLPTDDPDRLADPGLPYLFWDGPGQPGNTDLVSRPILCTFVSWDGTNAILRFERLFPAGALG